MKFAVTLALLCPLAAQAAPAELAYYENASSLPALQAEAGSLNTVAADLYAVNLAGRVTGATPANVLSIAATHAIGVLAVVSNYGPNGFSARIAKAVLTPGAVQDRAVAGMLRVANQKLAGINLDFESVPFAQRANYTAFATRLATALHAAGKTLVLSVPAKSVDDPTDTWTGAYDYAALGGIADTLQVMTYDENGPWSAPGPVSGLDWMSACLAYTQTVVASPHISLGFPAYGYDWNRTARTGTQLAWNQVPALLQTTGATPQWNAATSSPWFIYTDSKSAKHVVWYENARSTALKAELAASHNVASVSVFALGFDDPSFWTAISAGFTAAAGTLKAR